MARRADPGSTDDVAASDLRWLAMVVVVLAVTIALFFGALLVYHATGPHALPWAVIRRLRYVARWLLPHWSHHWRAT